jgi:DNA-binding transcriptional MocR family regulator
MEKYRVEFGRQDEAKYSAIAQRIKRLIDESRIVDGEKLPSIRALAAFLGVNTVTIVSAYNRLENEGYAVQKKGSGTYAKMRDSSRSFKKEYSRALKLISSESADGYIDLTGEMLNTEFFPITSFKSVLDEVLDRDGAEALITQEALGYEGLRETISRVFWNEKVKSDDILIVTGAQQGIDIISKALINQNDYVLVEKPTYSGALSVFKSRMANIIDMPIGKNGIDVDKLEKVLMKNSISCFYTMSYFQNPSGMSYGLEEKKRILELAEIYDFFIIEDDYLSELIFDESIPYSSFRSLDRKNRVIYVKSFSKLFLPGIRLGYLITPPKYREAIQNSKFNTDIATSSLMQRALEMYINKGYWIEYIDKLKNIYKSRYRVMEQCIKEKLGEQVEYISPGGGLHFYLRISDSFCIDAIKLFRFAKAKKVLVTPGGMFYKNPMDGRKYFRLSFSTADERQIGLGIEILSGIISDYGCGVKVNEG